MPDPVLLAVDTPIATPSGRRGIVVVPPGGDLLPKHCLVKFENNDRQWLLAEILQPAAPEEAPQAAKRKRSKKAAI